MTYNILVKYIQLTKNIITTLLIANSEDENLNDIWKSNKIKNLKQGFLKCSYILYKKSFRKNTWSI